MKQKQIAMILALGLMTGGLSQTTAVFGEDFAVSGEDAAAEEHELSEVSSVGGALKETAVKGEEKDKKEKSSRYAVDSDGLIEDDGKVTSGYAGELLDEVIAREEAQEAAAGWIPPGFRVDPWKYPAANLTQNTETLYWYLRKELELNHAAACGVLANVQLEANFRPIALGDGGTSYGICQWHLGRFTRLMDYCKNEGLDYNTLEGQMAYLDYELQVYYPQVLEDLLGVEDNEAGAYEAGYLFCYRFEMPDQLEARSQQRGHLAEYEYYPQEFVQEGEEGYAVTKDPTDDPRPAVSEGETYVTPGQVLAPEEFQINLFELG